MELQKLLHFPETFIPLDEGDPYFVIARHPSSAIVGLRLSPTVLEVPGGSQWVSILGSLNARSAGNPMTPVAAMAIFSRFEFKLLKGECISECVLPLIAMPCSPSEIYIAYARLRDELPGNLAEQLEMRFASSAVPMVVSRSLLEHMIVTRLDDLIPEVSATCNDNPGFLFSPHLDSLRLIRS
jgi:hypothetical protein